MMSKFMVGDRVVDLVTGEVGEVTNGFLYRAPGTGLPPKHGQVPVQWDSDVRTYVNPDEIDYEAVTS